MRDLRYEAAAWLLAIVCWAVTMYFYSQLGGAA